MLKKLIRVIQSTIAKHHTHTDDWMDLADAVFDRKLKQ
jgi:hypothetical protein